MQTLCLALLGMRPEVLLQLGHRELLYPRRLSHEPDPVRATLNRVARTPLVDIAANAAVFISPEPELTHLTALQLDLDLPWMGLASSFHSTCLSWHPRRSPTTFDEHLLDPNQP